jgi:hypothetical protein
MTAYFPSCDPVEDPDSAESADGWERGLLDHQLEALGRLAKMGMALSQSRWRKSPRHRNVRQRRAETPGPKESSMIQPRLIALASMVLAATATRLFPHPPNMTSIAAVALFAGAYFQDRRLAFAVPLTALFLGDLVIGFHDGMPVVYLSFALIVGVGLWLGGRRQPALVAGATLFSAVLFFVLTNFGVWAFGDMYPRTGAGLVACYVAALPFFGNTVAGDLFYALLLFGGFALLERRFTALRQPDRMDGLATA